jgi:ATP-dependent DNA ligase
VLFAFDLIEHVGDLRDLLLIERKRRLSRLLGRAKRYSIRFVLSATRHHPCREVGDAAARLRRLLEGFGKAVRSE